MESSDETGSCIQAQTSFCPHFHSRTFPFSQHHLLFSGAELDNLVSIDTKKTLHKHNKHYISDEGHRTHQDDLSDRRSIPSRSTSPKSDLEDGWNLVEDDLPPPEVRSGTSTPKEGAKKDSRHGGSASSGVSWNLSLKNKVYCSLYNMYHSRTYISRCTMPDLEIRYSWASNAILSTNCATKCQIECSSI